MSVDIHQRADGGLGMAGTGGTANSGFVPASTIYNVPAADFSFFVADRPYVVVGIRGVNDVIGTGGACTAVIRKVPSGTALTSGTALHSSSFNLVGTAATVQTLTLSTAPGPSTSWTWSGASPAVPMTSSWPSWPISRMS